MKRQYCVIGDPIAHSLSPAIHNKLFELYNLKDVVYTRQQVSQDSLPAFISGIPSRGIQGFNITMPLKDEILGYLTYTDPSITCGCNTVVVNDPAGLSGYSTDAQGFEKSLELHGHTFRNANVVFLGCGSAAKTLIYAAVKTADSVVVLNRTLRHASEMASLTHVTIGELREVQAYMPACTLLVNTTPLGMSGTRVDFDNLGFLARLPKDAFVADLIYSPPQTRFLQAAARTGHAYMNGLWMLIWQAFYAFEKFTGIMPDMQAFKAVVDFLKSSPAHPVDV